MEEKIKILLVDDENDVKELIAGWLQLKGYEVMMASNGQEAIDLVKKIAPDIMFLDLRMPVLNGHETLKKLREFNRELPVIIISAHLEKQEEISALNSLGISGVFYKGKDFQEALSLIETALRTHKKLKKS